MSSLSLSLILLTGLTTVSTRSSKPQLSNTKMRHDKAKLVAFGHATSSPAHHLRHAWSCGNEQNSWQQHLCCFDQGLEEDRAAHAQTIHDPT